MKRKMNRILSVSVMLVLLLNCFTVPLCSFADEVTEAADFMEITEIEAAEENGEIAEIEEIAEVTEIGDEENLSSEESELYRAAAEVVAGEEEDPDPDGEELPSQKKVSGVMEVAETAFFDEEGFEDDTAEDEIYIDEETGLMLGSFVAPAVKKQRMLLGATGDGKTAYDRREDLGPAKQQGGAEICWAFSTVGLAEASMKVKDGSYSENGLAYFMYNSPSAADPLGLITGDENKIMNGKTYLTLGGNPHFAMMMLSGFEGVQTKAVGDGTPAASAAFKNTAVLENSRIYNIKENPELVKEAIKTYGGVTMEYYAGAPSEYKATNSTYVRYYTGSQKADHSVMIVGWNDNFDKKYFSACGSTPSKNGAWLVRNSWGTSFGDKGYFWISYEDKSIGTNAVAMKFVPASSYKYNYHYDGSAGYSTNIFKNGKVNEKGEALYSGTLTSGGSVGNVFRATNETQEIKAVSVGFASANVGYTVEVYRSASPMETPVDGTLVTEATTKGTTDAAGIYTITLKEAAYIPKNYYFSVVLTTTGTGAIQLFTDQNVNYTFKADETAYLSCINQTAEDQSYIKTSSGSKWADLYYSAMTKYNADGTKKSEKMSLRSWTIRLKALTNPCAEKPVPITGVTVESVTAGVGKVSALKYTITPDNASLKGSLTFTSSDPSVFTVTQDGKVKGVKPGTASVTISAEDTAGNKKSATAQVTVYQYPDEITLPEEKTVSKGKTIKLTLKTTPTGAKTDGLTFEWKSDDTSAVKIKSVSGTSATVSGVDEGWADISVTCKEYPYLEACCTVEVTKATSSGGGGSSGSGGGGGSGSGSGAAGPGAAGPGQSGQTGTYSSYWYQEGNGDWKIKDKTGKLITTAWLCDDAVMANGQNVWYLLDQNGKMLTGGLVQDNTGNFYSLEMNHDGYYGMLRYKNGTYDGIYMEFSQNHDGTFGKILNQSAIDALKAKYGVTTFGVGNESCTYTSKF